MTHQSCVEFRKNGGYECRIKAADGIEQVFIDAMGAAASQGATVKLTLDGPVLVIRMEA